MMLAVPLLTLWVPGVVESPNALWRRHPMQRHQRVKAVVAQVRQLTTVHALLRRVPPPVPPLAVDFCLVRRRLFDEGDNLPASLKHHRDGVMRALGTHDGRGSKNTFTYQQRLSQGQPEGVAITITTARCGPSRPGCVCRCPEQCGHVWTGPWLTRTLPSGAVEDTASCVRCGLAAIDHDRWVLP